MSTWLIQAGAGRWAVGGLGVVFAVAMLGWAVRGGIGSASSTALGAVGYASMVWWLSTMPIEVVHLAEYGGLALVARWALGTVWPAIALTFVIGLADEWTQGVTPGRFFDWRDVWANLAAGALPIWLTSAASSSTTYRGARGFSSAAAETDVPRDGPSGTIRTEGPG